MVDINCCSYESILHTCLMMVFNIWGFTGKRDIKVKALEAAEAAKRLEEKRVNERKIKKEALKLERARIEQENMQQMELKMKKKEEEQKKKDADMAARKRLREQEQQKEKERKRKRIGEVRRHQIEQEEKLRIGKVDKEVPLSAIVRFYTNALVISFCLLLLQLQSPW